MIGWVILEGGARAFIDQVYRLDCCKACGTPLLWGLTEAGKKMPIEKVQENGNVKYYSHFARCPKAKTFRRKN